MNRPFSILLQTFTVAIVVLARANMERKLLAERVRAASAPRPRRLRA